jgi:small subunit ribosomal protein S17
MADEEQNKDEQKEEQQAPVAAEAGEQPAPDAPAEEPAEEPAADQAEEPAAEQAPAGEPAGDDELEGLDWKARRRLERSRRPAEARPQQPAEQRVAEREERRRGAAKRRAAYRDRGRRRRKGSGEGTPPAVRDSVAAKVRQGTVVSSKADKTITVRIDTARRHPSYEKIVRRSSTLHAHDERNEANEGDLVRLVETRPISRTKRWRLIEILERAR